MHLLGLFKRKAEEERLLDIVDKYNEDMQTHRAEVVEMMRVAVWCLQSDFSRRPSMSVVVKVLEGSVDVQSNLDYSFTTPVAPRAITVAGHQEDHIGAATPLFASVLSGPRPSMSVMVKVLEGSVDVGSNLDYSFITAVVPRAITVAGHQEDDIGAATPLFPISFIRTEPVEHSTAKLFTTWINSPSTFINSNEV
ncbi:G-type lectin S-receptor-like serine/threonine-protein kinase SD2-5 [Camellia lanceoleosa]|uniref:G-type lectin S-receptor-like serine/threonine-protein kinase SD2-5 n=1 Tax=Camellia lanceoleosa TaxID=1840588 RepID=A0ACC0H440_9ERIC|nr:G-type lectin S-receptor-like serine/threonine-protein kinase SD2-5 [Camellia lanceoleosa]